MSALIGRREAKTVGEEALHVADVSARPSSDNSIPEAFDLVAAVGVDSLYATRRSDAQKISWVKVEVFKGVEREVKPIFIDPAALLKVGCTEAELNTPQGKAKLTKVVSTLRHFHDSGFSKDEIIAAMTFAPRGKNLAVLYPDLLSAYLCGLGISKDRVDLAEKAGMLPVFANLYLADFFRTFADELSIIEDMFSHPPEETDNYILRNQFSILVGAYLPDHLESCSEYQTKRKREDDKKFLRQIGYHEKIFRESEDLDKTIATTVAKWLEEETTYNSILARIVQDPDQGQVLKLEGEQSIPMSPETLQQIFRDAEKARCMGKTNVRPPEDSGIPGSFLAILSPDAGRLTLIYWSGDYRSTLSESDRCIGAGDCGLVQAAEDIATGNVMAFKTVNGDLSGELYEGSKVMLRNEWGVMMLLNMQPGVTSQLIKKPYAYIEDGKLAGYLMYRYACDLHECASRTDYFPMEMGEVYTGLINVLENMRLLHSLGILHTDLRLDNILIDAAGTKPVLVISDYGLAQKVQHIIDKQFFSCAAWQGTCGLSDEFHLMNRMKKLRPQEELKQILEKREVYAFGKMVVYLLTQQQWDYMPDIKDHSASISRVYGAKVNDILMQMVSCNPSKRPTVEEAIAAFKEIVNDPTPEGQQRLQKTLNKKDQHSAVHFTEENEVYRPRHHSSTFGKNEFEGLTLQPKPKIRPAASEME